MSAVALDDDETLKVERWSEELHVSIGVERHIAILLVAHGVHWTESNKLLSSGCPPELIIRILA